MVGLEGRMLHSAEELRRIVLNDIDFAQVRDILDEKRFMSADFLNTAIG